MIENKSQSLVLWLSAALGSTDLSPHAPDMPRGTRSGLLLQAPHPRGILIMVGGGVQSKPTRVENHTRFDKRTEIRARGGRKQGWARKVTEVFKYFNPQHLGSRGASGLRRNPAVGIKRSCVPFPSPSKLETIPASFNLGTNEQGATATPREATQR